MDTQAGRFEPVATACEAFGNDHREPKERLLLHPQRSTEKLL
jgi:hypothetical protein